MPNPWVHCPSLSTGECVLPPEEGHHAANVLRLRPGDPLVLFDGRGQMSDAVIARVERRVVVASAGEFRSVPFDMSIRLTLLIAVGKAHRQGYLVEKCTELGAARIAPIMTHRSVTRPGEMAAEKWRRRAIEACKQCHRAWVPVIDEPRDFDASAEFAITAHDECVVGHPGGEESFRDVIERRIAPSAPLETCAPHSTTIAEPPSMAIFIGPEGGWADDELRALIARGVAPVALSPSVLRTETAAVAACAAVALASVGRPGVR